MPITQGNGLDVSSAGVSTPRPVNPAIAQNISATNQSATQVTNDIPLGSVSEAMTEASASLSHPEVQEENQLKRVRQILLIQMMMDLVRILRNRKTQKKGKVQGKNREIQTGEIIVRPVI